LGPDPTLIQGRKAVLAEGWRTIILVVACLSRFRFLNVAWFNLGFLTTCLIDPVL
jgi:hypothetical protein